MAKSRLFSGVMRVSSGNTMSKFYTPILSPNGFR